jgi:hypothetical protein
MEGSTEEFDKFLAKALSLERKKSLERSECPIPQLSAVNFKTLVTRLCHKICL